MSDIYTSHRPRARTGPRPLIIIDQTLGTALWLENGDLVVAPLDTEGNIVFEDVSDVAWGMMDPGIESKTVAIEAALRGLDSISRLTETCVRCGAVYHARVPSKCASV